MATGGSTKLVWIAVLADFAIALSKIAAAAITSSPALAAEASHSLADTANDLFFVLAERRSSRHLDEQHPFGYGREAYFWALIAALGAFIAGAAFSLREGIENLIHPGATTSFIVAYVVLGVSTVFDLVSLRQSAHQMSADARLENRTILDQSAATSDPSLRGVFNQDLVSIAGDIFALAGLGLSQILRSSIPQSVAAVLIALVLIRVSLRLVKRNHDFLLGQPVGAPNKDRIRDFVLAYPGITAIRELLVTYVGPGQVWVLARVEIGGDLRGEQVMALVSGIEADLRRQSRYIFRVDVVPSGEGQGTA